MSPTASGESVSTFTWYGAATAVTIEPSRLIALDAYSSR